jgi:hypothetical protein
VLVQYTFAVPLTSNVSDAHEGGTVDDVEIGLVGGGPNNTINRAQVTVTVLSEIGDVDDYETSKKIMPELEGAVRHGRQKLVALLGRLQWKRRLREGENIQIAGESGTVTRQVVGSEKSFSLLSIRETLRLRDSVRLTVQNAETGETVAVHAWPDTSPVSSNSGPYEAVFSWLYQASTSSHPFEAFRYYYLVVEHLAGQGQGKHLELVLPWLASHGIQTIGGQAVNRDLLRRLYVSGRCAISHAKDDFKLPTDPDDEASIKQDLPLIRELALACIDKVCDT